VSKSDEFRRNADECQRMADRTCDDGDKRAWLRLAQSWLAMIRPDTLTAGSRTAADHFDERERVDGTRQLQSTESH
jgi:hypothetical protein